MPTRHEPRKARAAAAGAYISSLLAPEAAGVRVALPGAAFAIPTGMLLPADAPFCQQNTGAGCARSGSSGGALRQQAGGRHRPPALLHRALNGPRSPAILCKPSESQGEETTEVDQPKKGTTHRFGGPSSEASSMQVSVNAPWV